METAKDDLTAEERDALFAIRNGADVTGYDLARRLRSVEQKRPDLIDIGPVMGNYGDGSGREPYFGCIATAAGKRYLRKARP